MIDRSNPRTDSSGVSESIGFLLIFTMVVVGIGLVTLYGYPMLLKQQVGADEQIMEKNMIVLQNDVKGLTYKTVPYKETSLKIGGGSLTVYNTSSIPQSSTIRVYSPGGLDYVTDFHSGDLRYESVDAQTDLSLQNGAVVLRSRIEPGSTMLAEPRWFFDSTTNTIVINLISLNSTRIIAKTGVGTVQMSLGETGYTKWDISAGTLVSLDYKSDLTGIQDYSTAWNNYFTNTMGMTLTATAGTTKTYQLPIDPARPATLVVKTYDVIIDSI